MRNAKIVCTLGPASEGRETIRALADAEEPVELRAIPSCSTTFWRRPSTWR